MRHKRSQLPRKPLPSHNDEGVEADDVCGIWSEAATAAAVSWQVTRGMRSGSHLLYCGRNLAERNTQALAAKRRKFQEAPPQPQPPPRRLFGGRGGVLLLP